MDNGACSYRRFRSGDDSGLSDIIKEYRDGLIFYLNSIVGDLSVAEELAEDTFVLLGTRKPRDKGKSSFKTWLYTIGRNIALNYLKKASRKNEVSIDEYTESISDDITPEELFIKDEQKLMLHKAMKKLKPEYRQVLWLIYFENFSNKEAAVVMKKSVHSVETLVYRARKSLRTQLETEGFVYEEL
ncbi:MAG: RNA polymerase sigma factor [Clostridia bacterium]|nr:RNA polymerase sigma factor [Clostridia bacterium]